MIINAIITIASLIVIPFIALISIYMGGTAIKGLTDNELRAVSGWKVIIPMTIALTLSAMLGVGIIGAILHYAMPFIIAFIA